MEKFEYLCQEKFDAVKAKLTRMMADGWEIPKLVACVYDLFQDYIISEEQEIELYSLVDEDERYNDVGSYWWDIDYENPLLQVI